jgi:quinol monooxygenase YgiN
MGARSAYNRKTEGSIMFVVTVTFEAYPEQAAAFLARVRKQAADSLANEGGCHRFDVCFDPQHPERVFLYEATAHFKAFDAEAGPMLRSKAVETWELAG